MQAAILSPLPGYHQGLPFRNKPMTLLGIAMIVIAALIAWKVTAFLVRLLLVGVVLVGLYLVVGPLLAAG